MIGDARFVSLAQDAVDWSRAFRNPRWTATATALDAVVPVLHAADARSRAGQWIVLALAYEAAPALDPGLTVQVPPPGGLLAFAAAYDAPQNQDAVVNGPAGPVPSVSWAPQVSRQDYDRALVDIRENIRQGEVYQVNYTLPLEARFVGDPAVWFDALARRQGARYNCHLDLGRQHILSFSPELFFSRRGEAVTVRPMKGTFPRGMTPQADAAQARALGASPKNQAENRMITDLLRNDLGRIARPGSVTVPELFTVEPLATAWQMTSTVTAAVPREIGLADLMAALFPCGSITGAPKRSAMAIINRLEPYPRGFYTGAIGHIAPSGDCAFSVAIRTIELDTETGRARFGVGGGITYDSEAGDEYAECRIKAAFLSRSDDGFSLLETLRLDDGRYLFLAEHRARLARTAAFYGFSPDTRTIDRVLDAKRHSLPHGRHRVRLLVSPDGAIRAETFPLPRRQSRPLRLAWADTPVDATDPALAHKTTRRALYDAALAAHPEHDDVLLRNTRGEVTESCRANLVVALDGRLLTPQAACGLLPGTFRARLLRRGVIAEASLTPEDLTRADRLWLINSVRLWMPAILDAPRPKRL